KNFSRGLSAVHREQANHQCSAVVISQRFALTISTCLDGAGNFLSVDIFQPRDHANFSQDDDNFHQLVRRDEAARRSTHPADAPDVVLIKLPRPIDVPRPAFKNRIGNIGSIEDVDDEHIWGAGKVSSGENILVNIANGDEIFVPDAWRPGEYWKLRAGRLEDCPGTWEGGEKLACALWTGP
ncbi:unnamed protein product, partial [Ostreobium quekettii]